MNYSEYMSAEAINMDVEYLYVLGNYIRGGKLMATQETCTDIPDPEKSLFLLPGQSHSQR